MAWEFPAVSQSRIEFWKQPQYTRKGMLIFTILFGFFGLHHFMLRSPQTGLMFLIANILSLGYCYFYDVIQLAITDVKELNTYGMSLPWGAAGIAKGMWKCDSPNREENDKETEKEKGELNYFHNPVWFFLYAILIPIAPLSKLASGDVANAMIGFLNLTIMPFGTIIYNLTMLYEYFMLFFKPADIFLYDVNRVFPYTQLGWEKEGRSSFMRLTPLPDDHCEDCDNFFLRMYKIFVRALMPMLPIILPILRLLFPPQVVAAMTASGAAVEQGAKSFEQSAKTAEQGLKTAEVGLKKAKNVIEVVGEQAKDLALTVGTETKSILESTGKVAKRMSNLATQIPQASTAALSKVSALTENPVALTSTLGQLSSNKGQQGGGLNTDALKELTKEPTSMFDYAIFGIIAAVLGGGFLLHTGRTLSDVFQQYKGPNDAPPPQHS